MSEFFDKVGTNVRYGRGGNNALETVPKPSPSLDGGGNPNTLAMTGQKRWAANHETFWGATQTYDELPAGLYRTGWADGIGPILKRQKVETDNLLELPDNASASIIAEFETFWQIADKFRERGFLHKRGFMLWGPPGSGKTSTVTILIKKLVEQHNGIVVFLDRTHEASACLQMVRSIEPSRPVVAIMEDIDALIERHGENEYLALLDGEAQVDNIVFIATTNYPERLDRRFVDRPSRFDTVRYVGMPSAAARRTYLKAKEPSLTDDELSEWVSRTEGFSVAHLKEMIIAIRCFGQPIDEVTSRLAEMHGRKPTSEDSPDRVSAGFLRGNGRADYHNGASRP